MRDLALAALAAAALSVPATLALGVFYFSAALLAVKTFGLNYGESPKGFVLLNAAVILTFVSYFVCFAVIFGLYS